MPEPQPQGGQVTIGIAGDTIARARNPAPRSWWKPGRVRSTVRAIQAHLTDRHGLVRRYAMDDGLEGREGAFLLCTFWLAQVQALAGELEAATVTFTRAASYANDVGLLAEEVDPERRVLLGNYPQAFSHVGLVNAAWAISQAREHPGRPAEVTDAAPPAG